jgi:iron complex transport system substrate-binding protein
MSATVAVANRRRTRSLALCAVVAALMAAGCTSPDSPGSTEATSSAAVAVVAIDPAPQPELPVTIVGADGVTSTITDVSRILPLWGSLNEVVFGLGLGERVVGRDVSTTFPGTENLPVVTEGHDVSAESVLSLRPTVVLAQIDTGPPEAIEQIRAAGVPVVVVDNAYGMDEIAERISTLAQALGVPAAGVELAGRVATSIDAAAEASRQLAGGQNPTVAFVYLRGSAGIFLLGGPGSGADSLIDAAAGVDAGTQQGLAQPFTPLTAEAMVSAAPEVLLVTTTGLESVGGIDGLLAMKGIAQTPAAANGRVVVIEDGLLYSFGVRTAETITELATGIHAPAERR